MKITDSCLRAEHNNFVAVRLVLASAVIFTHCFWLIYGPADEDQFSAILGRPISTFAVDGFFFLSGFLVYASLIKRKSVGAFIAARFFRLWPALAVAVTATALGGALFTNAPLADYFSGQTLGFVARNLSLHSAVYQLTGIQCAVSPCLVNGSLWTIPWEVRCYELLAVLGLTGLAQPALMGRVVLPATFTFALLWHLTPFARHPVSGIYYYLTSFDRLWTAFALGIAAYLLRERIYLNWWIALLLLVLSILEHRLGIELHLGTLFIGYAVLCGGLLTARDRAVAGNWPDYSYGMYIYAFPVMMLLWSAFPFRDNWTLALANATLTLPIAALSWHFIEKPVLDWSKRRRAAGRGVTRRPAMAAAATGTIAVSGSR